MIHIDPIEFREFISSIEAEGEETSLRWHNGISFNNRSGKRFFLQASVLLKVLRVFYDKNADIERFLSLHTNHEARDPWVYEEKSYRDLFKSEYFPEDGAELQICKTMSESQTKGVMNVLSKLVGFVNENESCQVNQPLLISAIELEKFFDNIGSSRRRRTKFETLNTVYYGPPGTGKTYSAIARAVEVTDNEYYLDNSDVRTSIKSRFDELLSEGRVTFTTFHQSYGYEEFIEGVTASTDDSDRLVYKIESGVFKRLAEKAQNDPENAYAIIIDEINRGNMANIMGELITLLEESKRKENSESLSVTLAYSKKQFSVPRNLFVIGTMNTADRSLVHLDTAIRRRFHFVEVLPEPELLRNLTIEGVDIKQCLEAINTRIEILYDREHTIGHAYFMPLIAEPEMHLLMKIFAENVIPLLQEYFFDDWSKISIVLGDNKKTDEQLKFLKHKFSRKQLQDLLEDSDSIDQQYFEVNTAALGYSNAYKAIYE